MKEVEKRRVEVQGEKVQVPPCGRLSVYSTLSQRQATEGCSGPLSSDTAWGWYTGTIGTWPYVTWHDSVT